jgi:CheY-like chemotaxis protein
MDLWMPEMDGYEATEHILRMFDKGDEPNRNLPSFPVPTVLAVSADVTEEAISRATTTGMEGFMTKPYKLTDLQRLIEEFCVRSERN